MATQNKEVQLNKITAVTSETYETLDKNIQQYFRKNINVYVLNVNFGNLFEIFYALGVGLLLTSKKNDQISLSRLDAYFFSIPKDGNEVNKKFNFKRNYIFKKNNTQIQDIISGYIDLKIFPNTYNILFKINKIKEDISKSNSSSLESNIKDYINSYLDGKNDQFIKMKDDIIESLNNKNSDSIIKELHEVRDVLLEDEYSQKIDFKIELTGSDVDDISKKQIKKDVDIKLIITWTKNTTDKETSSEKFLKGKQFNLKLTNGHVIAEKNYELSLKYGQTLTFLQPGLNTLYNFLGLLDEQNKFNDKELSKKMASTEKSEFFNQLIYILKVKNSGKEKIKEYFLKLFKKSVFGVGSVDRVNIDIVRLENQLSTLPKEIIILLDTYKDFFECRVLKVTNGSGVTAKTTLYFEIKYIILTIQNSNNIKQENKKQLINEIKKLGLDKFKIFLKIRKDKNFRLYVEGGSILKSNILTKQNINTILDLIAPPKK